MTALLAAYLRNTISDADRMKLEEWLAAHPDNRQALEELLNEHKAAEHWQNLAYYQERTERARMKVAMAMEHKRSVTKPMVFYRAAAAVLLLIAAGAAVWMLRKPSAPVVEYVADVLPGTQKAKLVMGNGRSITLDNTSDTAFVQGASVKVNTDQGLLTYEETDTKDVQYHQLITPKGGQYHLRLEDGTEVWLNAASSIRFPTRFTGLYRIVELTGEAYFEVAPDAQRPFKVSIDEKNGIDVLGTSFNVNAYKDEENIHTTLLEGAVKVTHSPAEGYFKGMLLKPGQQAVIKQHGIDTAFIAPADTARAVAWKNGFFDFNDVKLAEVMRQVSRWYDIDIVYEKGVPDIKVWGRMKRNQNLQQLIRILNEMDVRVRLESGNRLIVLQ